MHICHQKSYIHTCMKTYIFTYFFAYSCVIDLFIINNFIQLCTCTRARLCVHKVDRFGAWHPLGGNWSRQVTLQLSAARMIFIHLNPKPELRNPFWSLKGTPIVPFKGPSKGTQGHSSVQIPTRKSTFIAESFGGERAAPVVEPG